MSFTPKATAPNPYNQLVAGRRCLVMLMILLEIALKDSRQNDAVSGYIPNCRSDLPIAISRAQRRNKLFFHQSDLQIAIGKSLLHLPRDVFLFLHRAKTISRSRSDTTTRP